MCFTPTVSLTTAIIEFFVATYILHINKSKLTKGLAIFIYFLGFYQFTEFMLCSTAFPELWARLGFITYTLLPALALHFTLNHVKKKPNLIYIYIIPVIYSLTAIINSNFILNTSCGRYFISVQNIFYNPGYLFPATVYFLYYFGFIIIVCYLLVKHYTHQKNIFEKQLDLDAIIAMTLSLVPALVLFFLFPAFSISFPSVYCQFALIFTIAALIAVHLELKIK